MSLFQAINELEKEQLKTVAKIIEVKQKNIDKASINDINPKVKGELIKYFEKKRKVGYKGAFQIVGLWRDYTKEIIKKKKVKPENKALKQEIIDELRRLVTQEILDDNDRLENLAKDILLLLWQEADDKEKKKFINLIKEDLERQSVKFSEEEIDSLLKNLFAGMVGGAIPLVFAIAAKVMLARLTPGLIPLFAIPFLGRGAAKLGLGILAGPVGAAFTGATFVAGAAYSASGYVKERNKLLFVQGIIFIYAYRFQNRISAQAS